MTLREVVIALVFGAIGAISAIVFFGPWSPIGQALYKGHMLREDLRKKDWRKHHPNIVSPRAQAAIQAYTKIERTLRRGSIERLQPRAARIAMFFGRMNPEIAMQARRLGRCQDLASAKAAFRKLARLFYPKGPPSTRPSSIKL